MDVIFKNKDTGKATSYRALLDSGAFMNVVHADIADVLDINLSGINTISFGGVGNSKKELKGKPYIVEVQANQKGRSHKFDSYVLFTEDINKDQYPLLGRQGFFDKFDEICFNYKSNKFFLTKQ